MSKQNILHCAHVWMVLSLSSLTLSATVLCSTKSCCGQPDSGPSGWIGKTSETLPRRVGALATALVFSELVEAFFGLAASSTQASDVLAGVVDVARVAKGGTATLWVINVYEYENSVFSLKMRKKIGPCSAKKVHWWYSWIVNNACN